MLWRKAEGDLSSARILLDLGQGIDTVCFLAQQAAEKSLKALLAFHNLPYPREHSLAALRTLILDNLENFTIDRKAIAKLEPFAVLLRYTEIEPTIDEATESVRTAQDLHARVGLVIHD